MNSISWAVLLFLIASITGCANPPITKVSNDTYMLSKEDHAGIFGSMSKLKADVITEANQFAESKGKVVRIISVQEKPVGNRPGDWATFELQFKLVDKNLDIGDSSLNTNRKIMSIRPDASVQSTESIDVNINHSNSSKAPTRVDVYSELLKLDDLKKRGIISEVEFQSQKAKLLSNN